MECNLCLKQSSEVVSLFAEDVVRLIEDLTEMLVRLPMNFTMQTLYYLTIVVSESR